MIFCLDCGEPVKKTRKICPACEKQLLAFLCPHCKAPVKEHWKRYLECSVCQAIQFPGGFLRLGFGGRSVIKV